MLRLREAFNPEGRCSPHKMLPQPGACIEPSKPGRREAALVNTSPGVIRTQAGGLAMELSR